MNIWVIILGAIQGITEFLPISSTAHLILIPYLAKIPDFGLTFNIGLHLGTLLSVLIYFLKDWIDLLVGLFKGGEKRRLLGLIILASIPAGIFGVLLDPFVEKISEPQTYPFAIWIILLGVISFGFIFLILEKSSKKNLEIKDLNAKSAISIGLWQILSLFPGVSRSGSTISGGMFVGLKREDATKFSFLLSLPVIGGAVLLKFLQLFQGEGSGDISLIFYGTIVSFIVGIISIHVLLGYVRRAPLNIFAYYRFILALAVLLAYFNLRTPAIIIFSIAIIYLIVGMVRKNEKAIS